MIPFKAMVGSLALYGYAYTVYNLFLSLSTVGIPPAMSKLISEYNTLEYYEVKERTYKLGKKILIFLGILLFFIMFFGSPLIAELIKGDAKGGNSIESISYVIKIISTAIIIVPYLSVTKGYLQGHKIMGPSSFSQIIEQIIRIIVILGGCYLCLYVLNLGKTVAIGIAVFGATIGALVAQAYLLIKIKKNKKELIKNLPVKEAEKKITDKEIIKKLIIYSIPFITFGLSFSIYDWVDLTTYIRTLTKLGFDTDVAEEILTIITTEGNKLNSVVLAISTGLITSLVPYISSAFVKKDIADMKDKVIKSFVMLLYITLPMAVGLSFLAKPAYYSFYGPSNWGAKVFCLSIFVALFRCIFTTSISIAQSFNKFKNVFISIFAGILVKIILQIPFMYLFSNIGLYPFWGAICATFLGLATSIVINLFAINKVSHVKFKEVFIKMIKFIYPLIIMIIALIILKKYVPFNITSRMDSIKYIVLYGMVGIIIYGVLTIKNGLFIEVFGDKLLKKLKSKK